MNLNFQNLEKKGISFGFPIRGIITGENRAQLAKDVTLATKPNTTIPVEISNFFDSAAIETLSNLSPFNDVFSGVLKSDFTAPYTKFPVNKMTGSVQPYSNYNTQIHEHNLNNDYITRENHIFQHHIYYRDSELPASAIEKITFASEKQLIAAKFIASKLDRFLLYGVAGKQNYGLPNDPSLAAPISPIVPQGGSAAWSGKTVAQRYNDVLALYGYLMKKSSFVASYTTHFKLCVSHRIYMLLKNPIEFNKSTLDMLNSFFSNRPLSIVIIPELYNDKTGETMFLIAENRVQQVVKFSYSVCVNSVKRIESGYIQDFMVSTHGIIIYMPEAIASMRGM